MKRRSCTGRNAKGTGPCQASAGEGFDTCARCGGRRKTRAPRVVTEADVESVFAACDAAEQHEASERALDAVSEAVLDENADAAWTEAVILDARDDVPPVVTAAMDDADLGAAFVDEVEAWRERVASAHDHEADPRPACGDCGSCPLCDAVLAYEDDALAHRDDVPAVVAPCRDEDAAIGGVRWTAPKSGGLLLPCDHAALASVVREAGGCDVLCTDTPYSIETHSGHGTMERWGQATPPSYDGAERREIDYAAWTDVDVHAFVELWEPLTRGWFLSLTDDVLAPAWKAALRARGRWVGTLIPCTERGGTVRLCGGGPSSCTTFLVVARPRTVDYLAWITTESHYVVSREKKPIVGGKALALMGKILTDYSRPGDLVCDPCAGAASALRMAVRLGRRAIGSEPMPAHYEIGRALLAEEVAALAPDPMLLRKQPNLLDAEFMRRRTA